MSEPDLPEDLSRWPTNPYRLLGVAPGTGPRDLRRAYTRLIRVFKPEQFPEHFRRIREAYEMVRRQADLFGPSDAVAALPPPPEEVLSPEQPQPAPSPRPQPLDLDAELDTLWRRAVGGEEAAAYQGLLELSGQHPGQATVRLRLYWLLTVAPEVDARRSPCDWLVEGLRASGLTGPLLELYRAEVAEQPAEALTERYGRLLECDVRPGLLADLVEWRWRAAARLERWDVLAADRAALRPRLQPADEEVWLRLLFTLADELLWQEADAAVKLRKACRREIKQHEHLSRRLAAAFDQFDFAASVAADMRRLRRQRTVPPAFRSLIVRSWNRPFPEVRGRLQALLEQIDQAPRVWLRHFDEVHQLGPAVLSQFGRLLDQFQEALEQLPVASHPWGERDRLAREFLDGMGPANYTAFRGLFLEFCVREAVAPERAAETVPDRPAHYPSRGVALSQAVAADWPLRCVYRACRLFGA